MTSCDMGGNPSSALNFLPTSIYTAGEMVHVEVLHLHDRFMLPPDASIFHDKFRRWLSLEYGVSKPNIQKREKQGLRTFLTDVRGSEKTSSWGGVDMYHLDDTFKYVVCVRFKPFEFAGKPTKTGRFNEMVLERIHSKATCG